MSKELDSFDSKITYRNDYQEVTRHHVEQAEQNVISQLSKTLERVFSHSNHHDLNGFCFELFGDYQKHTYEDIAMYLLDKPKHHISELDTVITHNNYLLFDVSDDISLGGFNDLIADSYIEYETVSNLKPSGNSDIVRKYEFIDIDLHSLQTIEIQDTSWRFIKEFLKREFLKPRNIESIDLKVLKYKYLIHTSKIESQVKGIRAIQLGTDNLDDILESDAYSNYRCNWDKSDIINIYNTYTRENITIPILNNDNYFMFAELKRNIRRLQMRFGDIDMDGNVKFVNTSNYLTSYK